MLTVKNIQAATTGISITDEPISCVVWVVNIIYYVLKIQSEIKQTINIFSL